VRRAARPWRVERGRGFPGIRCVGVRSAGPAVRFGAHLGCVGAEVTVGVIARWLENSKGMAKEVSARRPRPVARSRRSPGGPSPRPDGPTADEPSALLSC